MGNVAKTPAKDGGARRGSEETRRRLLAAATAEFAEHGIAGARVDRIAEAAGANKQAIYAYFSSKEGLFDAVFDAMVLQGMETLPIDAYNLPEYAARLHDRYQEHPEVLRIATWYALERGHGTPHPSALRSSKNKIAAIREAQAAGAVTKAIPAEDLLMLVLGISRSGHTYSPECINPKRSHGATRQHIANAVRRLSAPD
jgi:AcrR family transcriptional regulator